MRQIQVREFFQSSSMADGFSGATSVSMSPRSTIVICLCLAISTSISLPSRVKFLLSNISRCFSCGKLVASFSIASWDIPCIPAAFKWMRFGRYLIIALTDLSVKWWQLDMFKLSSSLVLYKKWHKGNCCCKHSWILIFFYKLKVSITQECIPVGCVPPAAVAVPGGSTQPPPGAEPPPPQGVGLETSLARSPSTSPLGVGLETPQPDPPNLPPWVWAWKPARHAGIPPPLRPVACWDTTPPPPRGQNSWHTLLKILPCPKLRLRAVKMRSV